MLLKRIKVRIIQIFTSMQIKWLRSTILGPVWNFSMNGWSDIACPQEKNLYNQKNILIF